MRYTHYPIYLLIISVFALLCNSCSTCSRQQKIEEITVDIADLAIDSSRINLAHRVFYALPTPIEVSMLIKNSGIGYQSVLLNDASNASKYLTHRKMALNLGVYTTDLTYAGLFEQVQTVLRYKQAILLLTEGLGIQAAMDQKTMQDLEANINDKDKILRIVSDIYASCTAYLDEDERYFLTLSVLAGGWVEGMYIATSLTDEKLALTEDRMKQLVIDQKLTFDLMWQAMSDVSDIPEVASLMSDMTNLAQAFDKISVDQTTNTVIQTDEKATEIKSAVVNNVTPELYVEIKNQIQALRHRFTKN